MAPGDFTRPDRPIRQNYRLASMRGLAPEESGHLTARMYGLASADNQSRWTIREVQALDFLRWRAEHGQIEGYEPTEDECGL